MNYGHVSNNRFHILDDIPFQKSFKFDMEVWHSTEDTKVGYSAISYWYSSKEEKGFYEPVPLEKRRVVQLPELVLYKEPDSYEGETLKVLSVSAGRASAQNMGRYGNLWSSEQHLRWVDGCPGAAMEIEIPVWETGPYRLQAGFTKASDYGRVQLYLDGNKIGDVLDLYSASLSHTGKLDLAQLDLERGSHIMRVEIVGANNSAVEGRYLFGLDFIKLQKVTSGR